MKKFLSVLLAVIMILSVSAITASAQTIADYAVSENEGATADSVNGTSIGYVGDADMSDDISIKDATAIQKSIAKLVTFTDTQELLADADLSGDISIKDATAIQKWIAQIAVEAPVFHLLYQVEAKPELSIVGTWETTSDIAEALNLGFAIAFEGDPLMTEHIYADSFVVKIIQNFDDNGTYTTSYERDSVEKAVADLKIDLRDNVTNYLSAVIKQQGANLTVNQLLAFMGYSSVDGLINEMITPEMVESLSAPAKGTYRIEGNKLYMTSDGEEDGYYENFTLTEDTLTLTSNSLGEMTSLYPTVFTRVN